MPLDQQQYGPVADVAQSLGIAASTLRKAICRGDVDAVRIGARVYLVSVASATRRYGKVGATHV